MTRPDPAWLRDERAAHIADVDETIRYWRTRGVRVAEIAQQFRCHANWPRVRKHMIAMDLPRIIEVPAYWVLGQVDIPQSIPNEFWL